MNMNVTPPVEPVTEFEVPSLRIVSVRSGWFR